VESRVLRTVRGAVRGVRFVAFACALLLSGMAAHAQETICARVKIEIKQELTLERQAFDAEMKISNTLANASLSDVGVVVKVTDETGVPVAISYDPNDTNAKFFIRLASRNNIDNVEGTGTVSPSTTAEIHWLLIPAPGAAGAMPSGKRYLVGATLQYRFGGEMFTLDVSPDLITVKPLPLLTLDYFLTRDVIADDPLTPAIEPIEPFTLGVRVKNNGFATAKSLKIDSAQPKIIENNQGLLINFKLNGSYLNDAPVQNTLLIDFGDVLPSSAKIGRWIMETSLAGTFTEFTARFTHSDELGGALTSLLEATNAHLLVRDVRVDLPGRDLVRDFLAFDGDLLKVYESDGADSEAVDRSAQATLTAISSSGGNATYRLQFPPTEGYAYVRLPDPYSGQKALGTIVRSDAKALLPENVWLSKTRNLNTNQTQYWVNFFDVNTSGSYNTEFQTPAPVELPPVIQFVADRTVNEDSQVSFLVEASSPSGRPVTLSAAPLPVGATFVQQPPDAQSPGLARAVFDWTPAVGTAGNYLIVYTARDGALTTTRSASIRVNSLEPPPGPGVPTIVAPGSDAHVPALAPTLIVQTSADPQDPTTQVQFEIYSDAAMTQLVETSVVAEGTTTGAPGTTSFTPASGLNDNTRYWWRARAYDGAQLYSDWVNSSFFVNLFNNPPETFNLASPAPGAQVSTLTPTLSWVNTTDVENDAITYSVFVYTDVTQSTIVASATDLPPQPGASSSWELSTPLTNHTTYYWNVVAHDALGAQTSTFARSFTINTGNTAPTAPTIVSPADGSEFGPSTVDLTIGNSTDADGDVVTYVFEIDTVSTFDSGNKRASGEIIQTSSSTTTWSVGELVENVRYWWRAKARDGTAESEWVVASFLKNAANDAPPAPTVRNPGDGAWSTTLQPTLEANPVLDPEGGNVRYEFEVYRNSTLVVGGSSDSTSWTVSTPLLDQTSYQWRVRALDMQGAASAWSAQARLYVSTGPYQDPTIQVTQPSSVVTPTHSGDRKIVTIEWVGTDNNIEPVVALYYSTSNAGYAGELIVDGLNRPAGTHTGSFEWDVSHLSPGAYYIYALIYDARGIGRAYAAGSVVVPNPSPAGRIIVTGDNLITAQSGISDLLTATFQVRLGSRPLTDVTIPLISTNTREGVVTPSLTFTPQDWSTDKTATVTAVTDCVPDGVQTYQVQVGPAVSLDPNYIGLRGRTLNAANASLNPENTTNNPNLHICRFSLVSKRMVNAITWEYVLKGELTNAGPAAAGVSAVLISTPLGVSIAENTLQFGAAGAGETVRSADTFAVRSILREDQVIALLGLLFKWNVAIQ